MILAGFIGYIVSGFIDHNSPLYGSYLSMSGFCAYPLLAILEKKGTSIISKFLK